MSLVADNRPAEFDARLMRYLPGLKKLSGKYVTGSEARHDLVTDTITQALRDWHKFREDGGFWNWLAWTMRGVASKDRQSQGRHMRVGTTVPLDAVDLHLSVPPSQDAVAELGAVMRRVRGLRHGDLVLRIADGETFATIARERGLCRERIRQIVNEARRELGDAR